MTEGHASVDNMPDLARVGAAKVKAKVCTETGKFSTITVPSNYKEPQSKNTGISWRDVLQILDFFPQLILNNLLCNTSQLNELFWSGCQHRATEYCDGEMLRGFMAWSFVQQCRYGGWMPFGVDCKQSQAPQQSGNPEKIPGLLTFCFCVRNGRLQLQAMHHGAMARAMQKFRGNQNP